MDGVPRCGVRSGIDAGSFDLRAMPAGNGDPWGAPGRPKVKVAREHGDDVERIPGAAGSEVLPWGGRTLAARQGVGHWRSPRQSLVYGKPRVAPAGG